MLLLGRAARSSGDSLFAKTRFLSWQSAPSSGQMCQKPHLEWVTELLRIAFAVVHDATTLESCPCSEAKWGTCVETNCSDCF